MGAIGKVWVRYEELKRELVGKTPEEISKLIEEYKKEVIGILEPLNKTSLWRVKISKTINTQNS